MRVIGHTLLFRPEGLSEADFADIYINYTGAIEYILLKDENGFYTFIK
jgi:hypothetical protein